MFSDAPSLSHSVAYVMKILSAVLQRTALKPETLYPLYIRARLPRPDEPSLKPQTCLTGGLQRCSLTAAV